MAQGISQRKFADLVGVSETAVRKAIKAGRINRLPGGLIDPVAARQAWHASTDPVRTKVRTPPQVRTKGSHPDPDVRTPDDAREAITLIAGILAEEGVRDDGKGIDFNKARTAELILKARQRALDQAVQEGELVNRSMAEKLFFDMARADRDAWEAWPARIAIELADELKVEARILTQALSRYVRQHLLEMGEASIGDLK